MTGPRMLLLEVEDHNETPIDLTSVCERRYHALIAEQASPNADALVVNTKELGWILYALKHTYSK